MTLIRTRMMLAGGLMAVTTAAAGIAAAGPASAASAPASAASAPASAASAPASAASRPVVLVNCAGAGQVRPASYDIGCMPSSEFVAGLKWTSWRSAAFGSGVLKVNDCTPTCAQGNYVKYPILVVLWRARPWPRHSGREYFSRLTWIFTAHRPGHTPAAQTFTLPASGQP